MLSSLTPCLCVEKKARLRFDNGGLVGQTGFEPATPTSRT